jgi:hypothetical protein
VLPFLALRAHGTALVYTATTARSILNLGTTAQYGGGGGITIAHRFSRAVQAALIADISYQPTYSVDIGSAIAASLISQQLSAQSLLIRNNVVPFNAGASAAYAPFAWLGTQLMGRYQHTFQAGSALDVRDALVAAADADVDLNPVPVGFLAGYRVTVPFGSGDSTRLTHDFDAGIFYTGRRDLALGIEGDLRHFPQRARVDSDSVTGSVIVRYYW